jgi:drug/metabolite transporter (DMT)-like permease
MTAEKVSKSVFNFSENTLNTAIPSLFVLLWSTGFIGLRLGTPFAEPFIFMFLRCILVLLLLGVVALLWRAPWPRTKGEIAHIAVAGLLVHATYLSGILLAINRGLPLGAVALIAGLQPVLTALFSRYFLGEQLSVGQWCGFALGMLGVGFVVAGKGATSGLNFAALGFAGIGLLGITFGTLYQKKFCSQMDLRTGAFIQFSATASAMLCFSLVFEQQRVEWAPQLLFALAWLAIVLSIGAISLLYFMIRRGAASKVASLFFLTPSVTSIMAWLLFKEVMPWQGIVGLVLCACGVALVMGRKLGRVLVK